MSARAVTAHDPQQGAGSTDGVRAVSAARTRRALIDAALALFAAQGYDSTTTEQIAERAGVSPRTFFRYFPTKESVVLHGELDFVQAFLGVHRTQPAELSDVQAVRASFAVLAPRIGRLRNQIRLYHSAVASSAALQGRERSNHEAGAAVVARAIGERRGLVRPDEDCELLAAVAMLVLQRATDAWVREQGPNSLAKALEAEWERLARLFP